MRKLLYTLVCLQVGWMLSGLGAKVMGQQCPYVIPTPGGASPVCPVDLVQIKGYLPVTDGLLRTQVWRDDDAIDNTGSPDSILTIFSGTSSIGLPEIGNDSTSSTSFSWPFLGIDYTSTSNNTTSYQYDWPINSSNTSYEQVQQDGWLIIPDSIDCITFAMASQTQKSAAFYISDDDTAAHMEKLLEGIGSGNSNNPSGDTADWPVLQSLPRFGPSGNQYRYARIRLYHNDDSGVANSTITWNIGNGFVPIPRHFLQSTGAPDIDSNQPIEVRGGRCYFAYRDAVGNLFTHNSMNQSVGSRILLDPRYKEEVLLVRSDVTANNTCPQDSFECDYDIVFIRQWEADCDGKVWARNWHSTTYKNPGSSQLDYRDVFSVQSSFNDPPSHPSSAILLDTIQPVYGLGNSEPPIPSFPYLDEEQFIHDGWLAVPGEVSCIQFELGSGLEQSSALWLGTDLVNLEWVAEETNGIQTGGSYCIPSNAVPQDSGWYWLRFRVFIDDRDGPYNALIKWDIGKGLDFIPTNFIQSPDSANDNTPPSNIDFFLNGEREFALRDANGNFWQENTFFQPNVPIGKVGDLDQVYEIIVLDSCGGLPQQTTGSTCAATFLADPCNTAPIAVDDTVVVTEGDTLYYIDVLANDYDTNRFDTTLIVTGIFSQDDYGQATFANDTIQYINTSPSTPTVPERVRYNVRDDGNPALSDSATLFIFILRDTDGDKVPDVSDLDNDNDGIRDSIEIIYATNGGDSDRDSIPDIFDLDSDNDGLPDILESGGVDSTGDGRVPLTGNGRLVQDVNNDGWYDFSRPVPLNRDQDDIPDFQDLDSDGDGILDLQELGGIDTNRNGQIDSWVDQNDDGWHDTITFLPTFNLDSDTIPAIYDLDSDNDGIPNIVEEGNAAYDLDHNGQFDNIIDADSNGAHDTRMTHGLTNHDTDTIPNYLDLDSDNDGISDLAEGGGLDPNLVGTLAGIMIDANSDGWDDRDSLLGRLNHDGDGLFNFLDLDSDNDGIYDILEVAGRDSSVTGRVDFDLDLDNDGWDDNDKFSDTLDQDGDQVPDRLDLDSDNDGIADLEEVGLTEGTIIDGMLNFTIDPDSNGADDGNMVITFFNTDNDSVPDHFDLDSDNDGIPDIRESGGTDADTNGVVDNTFSTFPDGWSDIDSLSGRVDYDLDGVPNRLDLDSDQDGFYDLHEAFEFSGLDTIDIVGNSDGRIDSLEAGIFPGWSSLSFKSFRQDRDGDQIPAYWDLDSDNDGLSDLFEDRQAPNNSFGSLVAFQDTNSDGADDIRMRLIPLDYDGDSIPNHLDLDSDQDGVSDYWESRGTDFAPDSTGMVDYLSRPDTDQDGWVDDQQIGTENPDGDAFFNHLDRDSDNDGIPDIVEASGVYPYHLGYLETISDSMDFNGWDDSLGVRDPLNTDGFGLPDMLVLDSDGDGLTDLLESKINPVDLDEDGMIDDTVGSIDGWNMLVGTANPINTDGDFDTLHPGLLLPDYRDLDSDNDGLSDSIEYNFEYTGSDCDNDETPDWQDADLCEPGFYEGFSPNGDGFNDLFEIEGEENFARDNEFTVYNRWGTIIYHEENWSGSWDGIGNKGPYASGRPAPDGIYFYTFEFNQTSQIIKGFFYLLR